MREIAIFFMGISAVMIVVTLGWANKLYLERKQREWFKSQCSKGNINISVSSITNDGQIVISKDILRALNLKAGDDVLTYLVGGAVILSKH